MGSREQVTARHAEAVGKARTQYGALCWRDDGTGVEVLLITSRDTGRWIIPKGWPMPGLAPEAAAAQEAWEEAGVEGAVNPICLGRYGYHKLLALSVAVPCAVAVYALQVRRMADRYPEVKERARRWYPQDAAASLVEEPDLARLIAAFAPAVPPGRHAPIIGE